MEDCAATCARARALSAPAGGDIWCRSSQSDPVARRRAAQSSAPFAGAGSAAGKELHGGRLTMALIAFIAILASAAVSEPVLPHQTFTIDSKVLHETRRINVYTPPGYEKGGRYP